MPHASGNYTQIGYRRTPDTNGNVGSGHWYLLCPKCWKKVSKFVWGWRGALAHWRQHRKVDRVPGPIKRA